jgi:hypothetical protein
VIEPGNLLLWERKGERGSQWTPACLSCGWSGTGAHAEAEAEGAMHLRGERHPWQTAPDQWPGREGNPTTGGPVRRDRLGNPPFA